MKGINDGNLHIIVSQQCNGGKQYDFQSLLGASIPEVLRGKQNGLIPFYTSLGKEKGFSCLLKSEILKLSHAFLI